MAHASKHHMGVGNQGKGSGAGGMTDLPDSMLEDNMVLSNRDKAQHGDERGLDSKAVQIQQFQDNSASHRVDPQPDGDEAAGQEDDAKPE